MSFSNPFHIDYSDNGKGIAFDLFVKTNPSKKFSLNVHYLPEDEFSRTFNSPKGEMQQKYIDSSPRRQNFKTSEFMDFQDYSRKNIQSKPTFYSSDNEEFPQKTNYPPKTKNSELQFELQLKLQKNEAKVENKGQFLMNGLIIMLKNQF
jgi:hypothetical protein